MFRNKEVRRFAALFGVVAAAGTAAGFAVCPAAGALVLAVCLLLGGAFWGFTRARYQKLAGLAAEIDQVLHNEEHLTIATLDEGELSILESEINKMTLRLREQNAALKKEKAHLADSLADIAHQLRTPLTAANLVVSLLKQNPDEPRRRALLRENEALFAQMDWLVTSLLKLSRLDAGMVTFQAEPVAVAALVRAAAAPLEIAMELHEITLTVTMPEGATLPGDFGWLAEAVRNLIKNCMESAGDGGKIEVRCEDNPLFTELTLHDSGPGFAPDELPHLFDRFYRGKSANATGYGIGLALCKSIITRQGGVITARNHPAGGAVFALRFAK